MTTTHRAIRRRLTLLASSSAGAIALLAVAGGAATLAPTKAMALDCGEQYGPAPIICSNPLPTGDATVSFGTSGPNVLSDPFQLGIVAEITDPTNPGQVSVTVGQWSIISTLIGVLASNQGTGGSSVQLGSNVDINHAVFGVIAQSRNVSRITAGSNLYIELNPVFAFTGSALAAGSAASADVDGPSAIIDIGEDATILNTMASTTGQPLIWAFAPFGTTSVSIDIGDGLSLTQVGEYVAGVFGYTNLGNVNIDVGTGQINVTGGSYPPFLSTLITSNDGILATSNGGDVNITSAADITTASNYFWTAGILGATTGSGDVTITSSGALTGDYGIRGSVVDGALNIGSSGEINANYGILAAASGAGSVTVSVDGDIHGGSYAVSANALTGPIDVHTTGTLWGSSAIQARGHGPVTVVVDGNLGSADQPVYYGVNAISGSWFDPTSSDVNVTVNGDVYAQSSFFIAAVSAIVQGDSGSATVNFGQSHAAALHSNFSGLFAQVYPFGDGDATINVGDGSTITATRAAQAVSNGAGDAMVQFGSGVTLNETLLGAYVWSHARSAISVGDSLTVNLQSPVYSGTRAGLYAYTTALADDELPSAEIDVGSNASFVNTDADAFDAAAIYAQVPYGLASAKITVGDGLNVQMAGEYVVGVAAATNLGDAEITVGSGSITLTGGTPIIGPHIAPSNAGVIADAQGGNVSIASGANISVTANQAPVFGIEASTTGSGDVTIASAGAITSNGLGISGSVVDGALTISSSGSVTGVPVAIAGAASGAGSIWLTSSGSVQGADAAIDVSTLTGDIVVDATGALSGDVGLRAVSQDGIVRVGATGGVTAVTTGIDATAHGAGALTVRAGGVQAGGIGVLATTDTSSIRVVAVGDVSAGTGSAIDANSGAIARVDVAAGATVSSTAPSVSIDAAGAASINNHGTIRSTAGRPRDVVIDVDAASATLNNTGTLHGAVDFSGAGSLAFVNTGLWRTALLSEFTAGGDSLDNTGVIAIHGTTIDFGGGADIFTNAGTLLVGDSSGAATLTLANLETFDNSGLIVFGSVGGHLDRATDDRLVAQGTAFTGSGASTLAMDVDLGVGTQANCSAATVADCFDLTGGSTAGSTLIRVVDTGQSVGALNTDGIVLVDVHGGTSAAGDFTLDPMSTGYTVDGTLGAGLEKGLFLYQLDYDAANQRHRLVSLPDSRAFEFAPLAASAQSVWYTSVGSWFDRQADLRDTLAAGDTGPGVWIKIAGANDNRDATVDYGPYAFNISNKQNTVAALAGIDLLRGASEGQGYVVGLTAGDLNSDIQFKASHRSAKLEGQSYGAYATWLSNSFFLDAIVQQNDLDLRAGDLAGAKGKVKSTGGQVEGGWRMPFASLSVEPLASLAYVRTKFDDLALPGATLHIEEAKSLRGSLGVRVSGDADLHSATLRWQTTARVWDEFEGKNRAVLISNGQSVGMPDDVSGAFGDVGVGVSLYSPTGHVSTFLNTGLKFKDDYRSTNTAVGFRVQW